MNALCKCLLKFSSHAEVHFSLYICKHAEADRMMWYSYSKACTLASIAPPFRYRKFPISMFPLRNSVDLYYSVIFLV